MRRRRRVVRGQHHFVNLKYLLHYATQAAWFESHRMKRNGSLFYRLIRNAMAAAISRDFKGYWQRKAG